MIPIAIPLIQTEQVYKVSFAHCRGNLCRAADLLVIL